MSTISLDEAATAQHGRDTVTDSAAGSADNRHFVTASIMEKGTPEACDEPVVDHPRDLSLIPSADLAGAPAQVWDELVRRWLASGVVANEEHERIRQRLGEWSSYCRDRGQEPLTADAACANAFRSAAKLRWAATTYPRRMWTLRGIYAFLVAEDVRQDNPVPGVHEARTTPTEPSPAGRALDAWLTTLAAGTASKNRAAVRGWLAHCARAGVDPLSATLEDVRAYQRQTEARLAPDGVVTALRALRGFYAYLLTQGLTRSDPTPPPAAGPSRALVLASPLPTTPDVVDLVERWLLTYSGTTSATHRNNITAWLAHCRTQRIDPLLVRPDAVLAYQAQVEAQATSYATARQKVSSVRAFYRFLVEERARHDNPALGTTRRPPAQLVAALAVPGQDRNVEQMAVGFLLQYTANTRKAYEQALRFWLTYCLEIGVDPLKVSRAHVDAFRALTDQRYSPRTTNQRLVIIRSFYRYCMEEGVIALNPARAVRLHRLPNVTTSKGATREELRTLLEAARRTSPQQHALFTLLALNGLRISEALGADVENLDHVRGHRTLAVTRKGHWGTLQNVPLAPYTSTVLDEWLQVRGDLVDPHEGNAVRGPLFITPFKGTRLSRQSAWNWMRDLAKRALPERASDLHPHDLRSAFITLALDAGVALRDVQDSAAHASADTTRRYDTGRNNLDRNATYALAAYVADGAGQG